MGKETNEERYRAYRHFSLYLTIPLLLAVSPVVGLYLGQLLDRFFHTGNILTLVFLVLGFIAGGREVYRILARASREDRAAREARDKRPDERSTESDRTSGPGGADHSDGS